MAPQLAVAYVNRGSAYGRLGQLEPAIRDLNEAIRLEPQLAEAYAIRAIAYSLLGDDARSQQDSDRAVELGFSIVLLEEIIEGLKTQR